MVRDQVRGAKWHEISDVDSMGRFLISALQSTRYAILLLEFSYILLLWLLIACIHIPLKIHSSSEHQQPEMMSDLYLHSVVRAPQHLRFLWRVYYYLHYMHVIWSCCYAKDAKSQICSLREGSQAFYKTYCTTRQHNFICTYEYE